MRFLTGAAFLGAALAAAGPGSAQQGGGQAQAEYKRNCTADYSRLCANHDPDSREVVLCFQRRINEVSPRCRSTIAKFGGGR